MALPATKTVVAMKDTSSPDLTIKVTGMQWKWGYDYLKGEGEVFLSCPHWRRRVPRSVPRAFSYRSPYR
jgi:heme/copper-type cytochrome/quinol oxidase subunit 2